MIPDFQTLMLPFLQHVADGKEHSTSELHDVLAGQFKLANVELNHVLPSGRQRMFIKWRATRVGGEANAHKPEIFEAIPFAKYSKRQCPKMP